MSYGIPPAHIFRRGQRTARLASRSRAPQERVQDKRARLDAEAIVGCALQAFAAARVMAELSRAAVASPSFFSCSESAAVTRRRLSAIQHLLPE